jgi:cytoskeleton protein RodZ
MTIGEVLRTAREKAGLSIDELSARTSIRAGLIKEMENNYFLNCGGDTYARGHIRNIAPLISMKADELIDLYNQEHSSERRGIHDLLVENSVARIPKEKKSLSWKTLVIISLLSLVTVGIAQVIISNSETVSSPPAETQSTSPTPSSSSSPAPSETAVANPTPITTNPVLTGSLTLVISATRGNANIHVVDNGVSLYKGPIFQGDIKTFSAENSISIYLSNAGDLDLTLNGEELGPLGLPDEEIRRTFRSQG